MPLAAVGWVRIYMYVCMEVRVGDAQTDRQAFIAYVRTAFTEDPGALGRGLAPLL